MTTTCGITIIGVGSPHPPAGEMVSTEHVLQELQNNGAEISERSLTTLKETVGVNWRWRCPMDVTPTQLSIQAAEIACDRAEQACPEFDRTKLGLIISGGSMPARSYPAMACKVAHALGVPDGSADGFDLLAACASSGQALRVAIAMMRECNIEYALLVFAEQPFSRGSNMATLNAGLWGDGAGAMVLRADPNCEPGRGFIHSLGAMAGSLHDIAVSFGQGTEAADDEVRDGYLSDGRGLHKYMIQEAPKYLENLVAGAGIEVVDPNRTYLLAHNANLSMIRAIGRKIGLEESRVLNVIEERGNTSSASIFITLDRYMQAGTFTSGDNLLIITFGAGVIINALLYVVP